MRQGVSRFAAVDLVLRGENICQSNELTTSDFFYILFHKSHKPFNIRGAGMEGPKGHVYDF